MTTGSSRLRRRPLREPRSHCVQLRELAAADETAHRVCFERHALGGVDVVVEIRDESGVAIGINTSDVIHWLLLSKLAAQDRETLIETCFHSTERTSGQIGNLLKCEAVI